MSTAALKKMNEAEVKLKRSIASAEFDYDYGEEINLKPFTPFHDALLDKLKQRARAAYDSLERVKPEWRKINESLAGYVYLDDTETALKEKDSRKPMRIVVPHLLAARETFVSAMAQIFLTDTIHPVWGRGPEDAVGAAKLERVLQAQSQYFKEELALLTMFNDGFGLGVGAVIPEWIIDTAERENAVEVDEILENVLSDLGESEFRAGDTIRYLTEEVMMEGNDVRNIDPFNLYLDPKSTINRFHRDAEYGGYGYTTSAMHMTDRELKNPGTFFNGKYVRLLTEFDLAKSQFVDDNETGREKRTNMGRVKDQHPKRIKTDVDECRLFIRIIPSEWGLGDEDVPRVYDFCWAGDRVITRAHKLDLRHNRIPMILTSPQFDGHEMLPASQLMRFYGLEQAQNFYHTSHMTNVRKTINDMFIVDPTKVDMKTVFNMGPGRMMLLKESVGGRVPVDQVIKQFPVTDVTRNHPADAMNLMGLGDKLMGVNDLAQGDPSNLPERPGQAGIQAMTSAQNNKLFKLARVIGAQAIHELTYQMAFNTQQFMSQGTWVALLGDYAEELQSEYPGNRTFVDPSEINVPFDIRPVGGSLPGQENMQFWNSLVERLLSTPETAMETLARFDTGALLMHAARLGGARNLGEFMKRTPPEMQVMPNEQVQQQAQAGNIVPINEIGGFSARAGAVV